MKVLFGKNLARCREGADVPQEELSFRASIHRTEVSLLERGERMPRVDTALRLAGSLGVPLNDLVAGLEWRPGYEIEYIPTLDVLICLAGTYSTSVGDLVKGVAWRPGWVEPSGLAEYLVSDDDKASPH